MRSWSSLVSAYGPAFGTAGHRPLLHFAGGGVEASEHAARFVTEPDGAVGEHVEPA